MRIRRSLLAAARALLVIGVLAVPLAWATAAFAATPPVALDDKMVEKMLAADGSYRAKYGTSIAISGDTLVVGSPEQDYKGAAYVYVRSGTSWKLQQKVVHANWTMHENFGIAVDIDGDTMVVASCDFDRYQAGAYVFTRSGNVWTERAALPRQATQQLFGYEVAISGGTIAMGSDVDDYRGAVFVYTGSGSSWALQQKVTPATRIVDADFGDSIGLEGDTLMVGAPAEREHTGRVYVFTRSGRTWSQQAALGATDAAKQRDFGADVALEGDTALVGAPWGNSVYAFTRSGGTWTQQAKLRPTGGSVGSFGAAVALSGATAVIGGWDDYAYVFNRAYGVWAQQSMVSLRSGPFTEYGGRSVAIDGGDAFIGVPGDDTKSEDAGCVRYVRVLNEDQGIFVPAPGVLANDTDADGGTLTAQLVSGPRHGALTLAANGAFTYTPDPDWSGTDSFTYQAFDGGLLSGVATVMLTVLPVNDPPAFTPGPDIVVPEDCGPISRAWATGVSSGPLESGSPTFSVASDNPALFSAQPALTPGGVLTFTPAPDAWGSALVTVTLRDASGVTTAAKTFAIDVQSVNDRPVAHDDWFSFRKSLVYAQPVDGVLRNDVDAEGSALTIELLSGPESGSIELSSDGSFVYTPREGFPGYDSFVYRVFDGALYSDAATATIQVVLGSTPPPASDVDTSAPSASSPSTSIGTEDDASGADAGGEPIAQEAPATKTVDSIGGTDETAAASARAGSDPRVAAGAASPAYLLAILATAGGLVLLGLFTAWLRLRRRAEQPGR